MIDSNNNVYFFKVIREKLNKKDVSDEQRKRARDFVSKHFVNISRRILDERKRNAKAKIDARKQHKSD